MAVWRVNELHISIYQTVHIASVRALPVGRPPLFHIYLELTKNSVYDEFGSPSAYEREHVWTQLSRQKQAAVLGVDVGCSLFRNCIPRLRANSSCP